ncbi:protein FAM204A-like [Saccostrea echinata]|uniref:protein FAM204A-like n=1 Tax=Saccostrea echinata TaxID=191078 RepID=UPI002A83EFB4|nr:protein FAM204A-like [Saccostrea echinata]
MYSRVPPITSGLNKETKSLNEINAEENKGSKNEETEPAANAANKPKNVRSDLWNKFKTLEKKTDEVTKRSAEKRIKHLQKNLMQKIQTEITDEGDKDILRQHDVKFGPAVKDDPCSSRKRKHPACEKEQKDEPQNSEWKSIKGFLNVNDHLKSTDPGKYGPKCSLEQKIDESIKEGDFKTAEELSDYMSTREFGKKIADAIDAKKFSQQLEEKKESNKEKKKKKLPWGFEHKQRWETKSAM